MPSHIQLLRRKLDAFSSLRLLAGLLAILAFGGQAGPAEAAEADAPPTLLVSAQGLAHIEGRTFRCALGAAGVRRDKREGDGATPAGDFPLREAYYRPDRLPRPPATGLALRALRPDDGWCDDPASPHYNRRVALPFPAGHERMWREDRLYDLVVVVGYNDAPPVPGLGSAIFLHVARPDHGPTAGCVAFALPDLLAVMERLRPGSRVVIEEPAAR